MCRVVDEGDLRSGSAIGSTATGVGMVRAESICTGSTSSLTPSALMIHEIDPTVKIWPGYERDEEPTKKAILFDRETTRKPLPDAPTIDIISSAVLRGVSHKVD